MAQGSDRESDVESWITPEETPALAAEAAAAIDARLARLSESQRLAFWASIRKAYNTPYNLVVKPAPVTILAAAAEVAKPEVAKPGVTLPFAAIAAAALATEAHAA